MALSHPYIAQEVAKVFFGSVFKLHGFPKTIVSDKDPIFLSSFWKELFSLQGTSLNFSLVYHPQSDGQTEVVNKVVEGIWGVMQGLNLLGGVNAATSRMMVQQFLSQFNFLWSYLWLSSPKVNRLYSLHIEQYNSRPTTTQQNTDFESLEK